MILISNLVSNFSKSLLLRNVSNKILLTQTKFESTTRTTTETSDKTTAGIVGENIFEQPLAENLENDTPEDQSKLLDRIRKSINAGVHAKGLFPTSDTHKSLMIDNIPYEKIHIVHVKSSKNNTIMSLTDFKGSVINVQSAGSNGFKNSKKSTAIAAQAASFSLAEVIKRRGIKNVRLVLKGIGNGRLATIKSLQTYGVNIVSLTDHTPIPFPHQTPLRPRKARRL